ncbi:class I SAM-dependent methyltransferase [Enterovirga rhinocerotis]|uniref:Methyltransferase family protein n=1 Tax=Enterovirga rhinocerotis TaxID=1339210 RepID=A0A4R7CBJ4_9HYPH|nr:class I SAM-dependent methyltransferase [Enterovirga rhinocerotis]TDR94127.1 methyltransferase family protein [Enterovirga rhinocerotis]
MLITQLRRNELLKLLPNHGEVAEIGVFQGVFSRLILDAANPAKLHLIDPWSSAQGCVRSDGFQMPDAYDRVTRDLAKEIESGQVVLHREFSTKVVGSFLDQAFDWIYVDAMHDYDNVLADLRAFKAKVKQDGFILGHDFSNHDAARRYKFGVVKAVRQFCQEEGFQIVLMTMETHPTYLLARSDNTTTLPVVLSSLFDNPVHRRALPIDIDPALLDRYEQAPVTHGDGRKSQMICFRPQPIPHETL